MLSLVLALMLSAPPPVPPEAEIAAVIDRMHDAASRADGAAYFAQFTPDARFIGTDVSERWSIAQFHAYVDPYFAQGHGWTYRPRDRVVTVAPIDCRCLAWFDEVLDNEGYGVVRGSGVLRLTEGGWKIEQYVLSFTVPNDKAKAVVEVIRGPATPAPVAGS